MEGIGLNTQMMSYGHTKRPTRLQWEQCNTSQCIERLVTCLSSLNIRHIELSNFSIIIFNFAHDKRAGKLNKLDKCCFTTYENSQFYRMKNFHDQLLKHGKKFKKGHKVLLFNSHLKLFMRKLKSQQSRPFTIIQVCQHSMLEIWYPKKGTFKVNEHWLKLYFGY